jgi:ABC-type uncharacterized transport system permease subunit
MAERIPDASLRDVAVAAGEKWIVMWNATRDREMPIGVGSMILGAAMVLFAARSMAGREGARSALVQVVLVHAGLVVAAYFLTSAALRAEVEFHLRLTEGLSQTTNDPAVRERADQVLRSIFAPLTIVLQTTLSAFIVLALTRPRARAFFHEAPSGPLGQG